MTELGEYEYTVEAWVDRFGSWLKGLIAKVEARQDVSSELLEGAEIVQHAVRLDDGGGNRPAVPTDEERHLVEVADLLRSQLSQESRVATARDPALRSLIGARPDWHASTTYGRTLRVIVDPVRARFGAWYEMFPRSCTPDASRSGTFRDA